MKHRSFGSDDSLQVSEIGIGTWQLGAEWGEVDDAAAQSTLEAALEQGVTLFDTADIYGLGKSERRIGEFLKRTGAEATVVTKFGRLPEPGWPHNFTPETIREHAINSIKRLGVERLALTQCHCLDQNLLEEYSVFDTLRQLRKEGLIERFGASVETMDEALWCLEQEGLASLQIIFNIFRQKPIDVLFEKAKAKGVAIIARLPLASGLLSGKFDKNTQFAESDHRNFNRDGAAFNVGETFAGLPFEKGVELADELKKLTPEGMTMAQMAQRWILDHDAVTTVITGARRPEQAAENARASDLPPLSPELHEKLREFYRGQVHEHIRGGY